MKQILSDREEK